MGDGAPVPGLPDEHCPATLDPQRVYAVAELEKLNGGLAIIPVDAPEDLCMVGWSGNSDRNGVFEQFTIVRDEPALLIVDRNANDHEKRRVDRFGLDWLGDNDENGWPDDLQGDPDANDETVYEWECVPKGRIAVDPTDGSISWVCGYERFDLDDQPLPIWQYNFVAIDGAGNLWGKDANTVYRTSLQGDVQMYEPPADPDGTEHSGRMLGGARAGTNGDGGWLPALAVEHDSDTIVERWSFARAGITVDGAYEVGAEVQDEIGNEAPLAFDREGALVALLPVGAELFDPREVVRIPLDGEKQPLLSTVAEPRGDGDIRYIYGLVTGP